MIELITYPHEMGEEEAKKCGFKPVVIGLIRSKQTTRSDTKNAAKEMLRVGVDLILFAGGDGTARDIYEAIDGKVPVLGIPSGVKIHSAVYAVNPDRAGDLAAKFLHEGLPLQEAEVMDVDEEAFRAGRVSSRLYGYLRIPYERGSTQSAKSGCPGAGDEEYQKRVIGAGIIEGMDDDCLYIIGPGSTTRVIGEELGFEKTLLGVDVVENKKVVAKDVSESQLLKLVEGKKAKIIVTPIGGQGYVFGRGNQQISPEVIRRVGKDNIIIVATKSKLNSLVAKPLLVDTGDEEADRTLAGYTRVLVGYREEVVKKIER
jgi:predicted polyphosphate/ATP-dependent NAD kinase